MVDVGDINNIESFEALGVRLLRPKETYFTVFHGIFVNGHCCIVPCRCRGQIVYLL